jgi:hypothetical protein
MGGSRTDQLAVAAVMACLLVVSSGAVAQSDGVDRRSAMTQQSVVSQQETATNPCVGTVERPANGTTVISVQGFNESGDQPAMLVGVGPRGEILWIHDSDVEFDALWSYDVDPMANGNVFVTAAVRGGTTVVYEFDPRTQEVVWSHELDVTDTHDVDLIDGGEQLLVANMRNYNETVGENDARIFVYNRTTEEIVWEWTFREHTDFEKDRGADYDKAWVHVNDVDEVALGRYLVSPRNFDQAFVVNRSTDEIELRLGSDNDYEVLNRPHNPDYLESENGTPTLLVADSHNDRVVEYAKESANESNETEENGSAKNGSVENGSGQTNGEWTRTWTLGSEETLDWPRDADRLPDGNTLITDTKNQRVFETTPEGEIVWEVYAPWLVYDAARLPHVAESDGPTMRDLGPNATGAVEPDGSAGLHADEADLAACHATLREIDGLTDEGRAFYGVEDENESKST